MNHDAWFSNKNSLVKAQAMIQTEVMGNAKLESELLEAAANEEHRYADLPGFRGIGISTEERDGSPSYVVELLVDNREAVRERLPASIQLQLEAAVVELPLRTRVVGKLLFD